MVYGCDPAWWRHRRGLRDFYGVKVSWATLPEYPEIRRIEIAPGRKGDLYTDELVFAPDRIGGGGNSGFQALNLAVNQCGARRIILIGFDMHDRGKLHWYGENRWPMGNNPSITNFRRWRAAFEGAAVVLRARGIRVLNTARDSALQCFPKMTVADALVDLGRIR
jgi:hypothetical protein